MSRLRPESAKHRADRARRDAVKRVVWRRDRGECQAKDRVPDVRCSGPKDPHEIIPRSAWSKGYLEVDNVITICRAHHDWVGDHPDLAHDVGLHGYSWERPDQTPETQGEQA